MLLRFFFDLMFRVFVLTAFCLALGACASSSRDVEPTAMPMDKFVKLSCTELGKKHNAVSEQIEKVSNDIDSASLGSRLAMGVGVVFWPALFLVDGKGDAQDELARLKGQRISIEDAMLEHNCAKQPGDLRAKQSEPQAQSDHSSQHPALTL